MAVRVGVIGAGIMGADHARTLGRFVRGAEVSLIADLDEARAAAAAEAVGARVSLDPAGVSDDADVDAVVIASPDPTHPDLLRRCAAAGKPVLCEKPLAPSFGEATQVVADLADAVDLVSIGFMRRFDPGYVDLKAALAAGRHGRPLIVHSTGRGVTSGPGANSEGLVTNSAIHDLDIVPWLLDSPVAEVSWQRTTPTGAVDGWCDPQVILLRSVSGVLAVVEVFLNATYGYDVRCEVVCESAALSLAEPVTLRVDSELSHGAPYAADWRPRFATAYRLELQAWIDHLGGADPGDLATLHDGWQSSAVAQAVITSMHAGEGAWVGVPGREGL